MQDVKRFSLPPKIKRSSLNDVIINEDKQQNNNLWYDLTWDLIHDLPGSPSHLNQDAGHFTSKRCSRFTIFSSKLEYLTHLSL